MKSSIKKFTFPLNLVALFVSIAWLLNTRDFEPAIVCLGLFVTIIAQVRSGENIKTHINSHPEGTIEPQEGESKELKNDNKKREFYFVDKLNPNITSDEKNILKRFTKFPRGQSTQGYRLDWIYNELITDIPTSTTHLLLENLWDKGFVGVFYGSQGSQYFYLTENGRHFIANNILNEE